MLRLGPHAVARRVKVCTRASLWVALVASVLTVAPAVAEARGRVSVAPFVGPGARRIRARVIRALRRRYRLVGWGRLGGPSSAAEFRRVAGRLGIRAFVSGSVKRRRGRYLARVVIRSGSTGRTKVVQWRSRSRRRLFRGTGRRLGRVVRAVARSRAPARARPRPQPQPQPDAQPDAQADAQPPDRRAGDADEEEEEEEEERAPEASDDDEDLTLSGRPRHERLAVAVGLKIFSRNLAYHQDLFGALRSYDLAASPAIGGSIAWYPAAHFSNLWYAHLGLTGAFRYAVGLSSGTSDGVDFPTTSYAFSVGVKYRLHFLGERLELSPVLAYGIETFTIEDVSVDTPKPEIPSVAYQYMRLGGEVSMLVYKGLTLTGRLGYLAILAAGEIESDRFFPRSSLGGIELGGGARYGFGKGFEVSAGIDLRRYFYSMNPEPGDTNVAGGAVDQFVIFNVALGYRMGR